MKGFEEEEEGESGKDILRPVRVVGMIEEGEKKARASEEDRREDDEDEDDEDKENEDELERRGKKESRENSRRRKKRKKKTKKRIPASDGEKTVRDLPNLYISRKRYIPNVSNFSPKI